MYTLMSLISSSKFNKVLDVRVSNDKGSKCTIKYIITPKNLESKDKCILYVYDENNIKIEIYTETKTYKFYRQPYKQVLNKIFIFGIETKLKKGIKYFIEEWISNLNSQNSSFKYYRIIGNYQSYQVYSQEELYRKVIEANLI